MKVREVVVFVPWRGVSYFRITDLSTATASCFRPLTGCKLFLVAWAIVRGGTSFRPLAGCKLFRAMTMQKLAEKEFSSPGGV